MSNPLLENELAKARFVPTRFVLTKLIRRLIWPFIRPFHLFHLSCLEQQKKEFSELRNEIRFLRTELLAFKNSYLKSSDLALLDTRYGIFIAKPGDLISDCISEGEIWDEHIVNLAQQIAKTRQGGAIDAGAHLGSTTMAFSSIFDHVYSFEPNDFNFKILQANIAINNLKNISLFKNALYSRSTKLSLGVELLQEVPVVIDGGEFDGKSSPNLGAYFFSEEGTGVFKHTSATIDSYEFKDIVFLKIDVQGADGEVLMGALETIRRCRPTIVFEWEVHLSKNFSVELNEIKNVLHGLGYSIQVLKQHNSKQVDYVAHPLL